ncbi:hypothetical protein M408DRAFT_326817 [Serendipita vermifera MAFF 305830]|uniref:Uncharacterized protein n=1 Tax=Serendipita vermifera MAFF 305830 TaxID=933852 RepID=A0A0C2X1M7_SERVB|nr:hypothetical protein M408DRAFT_326817 [Serendipita vermifera MAFF 305830]
MASASSNAFDETNGLQDDHTKVKGATVTANITNGTSCCNDRPEFKNTLTTGGDNESTSHKSHYMAGTTKPALSFTGDIGQSGFVERNAQPPHANMGCVERLAQAPNTSGMMLTCCGCSPVACQIGDGNGCNCEYGCPCGCAYGINPMIGWSVT